HRRYLPFDPVDPDFDQVLAVSLGPAELLAALLLENEDLTAPNLAQNRRQDASPGGLLAGAGPILSRDDEDLGKLQLVPFRGLRSGAALDANDVSGRDLHLFSPGTEDGVHRPP